MNKIYLIDKPIGITSFDVLRKLRKILNIKKMWHTWTLDPLATGALLVAIWNYTKLIPYFEKDTKEYIFKIWLDWITETFDIEKSVKYITQEKRNNLKKKLSKEKIECIINEKFVWSIEQVPPKYSAIKIWWKKALDKVRLGEDFEMKKRKIIIYSIDLLEFNYPDLTLKALVSAWTYIRSIASDLGEIIWSWGYIKELRRTKIGNLDLSNSIKLDDFKEDNFLNIEKLFWKDNFLEVDNSILWKLNNWLSVKKDLYLDEDKDYFVKKWDFITNIISYNDWLLVPKRKIL